MQDQTWNFGLSIFSNSPSRTTSEVGRCLFWKEIQSKPSLLRSVGQRAASLRSPHGLLYRLFVQVLLARRFIGTLSKTWNGQSQYIDPTVSYDYVVLFCLLSANFSEMRKVCYFFSCSTFSESAHRNTLIWTSALCDVTKHTYADR